MSTVSSQPIPTPEPEYVDVEIDVAIDADGICCASGPYDEGAAAQFVREAGGGDDCVQTHTVKLRLPKPRRAEVDLREPLLPFDPTPVSASVSARAPE